MAKKNNANKYWIYGEDALLAARFSKYLSKSLRNRRADYLSQLKKNKEWEVPYEDLSDAEKESVQESSATEDDFGWPRNPDGYNKLVKRVAQKAGISDIHPHMFRHTFVSLLMSNPDIGVATVAAEAGHAQPSTTLMIYTQQYKKRRESIRNQLSRELYEK